MLYNHVLLAQANTPSKRKSTGARHPPRLAPLQAWLLQVIAAKRLAQQFIAPRRPPCRLCLPARPLKQVTHAARPAMLRLSPDLPLWRLQRPQFIIVEEVVRGVCVFGCAFVAIQSSPLPFVGCLMSVTLSSHRCFLRRFAALSTQALKYHEIIVIVLNICSELAAVAAVVALLPLSYSLEIGNSRLVWCALINAVFGLSAVSLHWHIVHPIFELYCVCAALRPSKFHRRSDCSSVIRNCYPSRVPQIRRWTLRIMVREQHKGDETAWSWLL